MADTPEVLTRQEYFRRAFNDPEHPAYVRKHWVISIFAVTYESDTEWTKDPYPYRLYRKADGFYFIDPSPDGEFARTGQFTKIQTNNYTTTSPLIRPESAVTLQAGDCGNFKSGTIDTTYGDWLFNAMVLVYAFGNKIPYRTGKINASKLEREIEARLHDDVEPGEAEDPAKIYVHEHRKFSDAAFQLQGYNYLWVPSASPKTLTRDPRIPALRAKLLEENKERLHDPAVIAKIDAELQQMDRAWVDDDGKDFYIKSKSYTNVRKKTMLMHGYEKPFAEGEPAVTITNALVDGWDFHNLPAMANSLREGSFNRGSETQLGGVKAKEAFRNFQNASISDDDCGTIQGVPEDITAENYTDMIGFFYVSGDKSVEVTPENAQSLVGTKKYRRSPMLCKTSHTDFCVTCMGRKMSENPNALGAMAAAVGSTFLQTFMKKMHVASLTTTRYDFRECMS